jgi:cytochrome c-type biogenesis protein CcsB
MDNLVGLQRTLDDVTVYVLLAATILYWLFAAFRKPLWLGDVATAAVTIGALTSGSLLLARWIESGHPFPVSNLYESLFFLCWCITTAQLWGEYSSRQKLIGVFSTPFALSVAAFASFYLPARLQDSSPLVPALDSNWFLLAGGATAMAFLWVTRRDKQVELRGNSIGTGGMRRVAKPETVAAFAVEERSAVMTLPAPTQAQAMQTSTLAETLDNVSYRLIGLGFPLLTIGIISGAVWANDAWGSYWSWDPKETWAMITWLVYAAYLHARITVGWQGRKPAILAVTGFAAVWITYLGVNFLASGLHSYGFFLKQG